MASSWIDTWGTAWGNSWGIVTAQPPDPPSTYPGYPVQSPKTNYNTRGRVTKKQVTHDLPDSPWRWWT